MHNMKEGYARYSGIGDYDDVIQAYDSGTPDADIDHAWQASLKHHRHKRHDLR